MWFPQDLKFITEFQLSIFGSRQDPPVAKPFSPEKLSAQQLKKRLHMKKLASECMRVHIYRFESFVDHRTCRPTPRTPRLWSGARGSNDAGPHRQSHSSELLQLWQSCQIWRCGIDRLITQWGIISRKMPLQSSFCAAETCLQRDGLPTTKKWLTAHLFRFILGALLMWKQIESDY